MFQIPSNNPASDGSLLAVMMDTLRAFVRDELDDCLPCRVEVVKGNLVDVQILPLMILTDGTTKARQIIHDIPIAWPGGSTGLLRFKMQKGALGLLKATDRDLTLVLQMMAEAKPNTMRRHSFSDAFFLPNDFRTFTEAGSGDVVLQTRTGDAHISLSDTAAEIVVGSSKAELSASEFSVTIGGIGLVFNGSSLTLNGIDIGPLHTHLSSSPGSPTGPVIP